MHRYAISIHTITSTITTCCYRCLCWIAMKLTMVLRPITEDALQPLRSNEVMDVSLGAKLVESNGSWEFRKGAYENSTYTNPNTLESHKWTKEFIKNS